MLQTMFQRSIFRSIFSIIICLLFFAGKKEAAWKAVGPMITPMPPKGYIGWSPHGLGRLFGMYVHPKNNQKIWVNSPNGGVFYTKNRGKNWNHLPMPCPGGALDMACFQLPNNKTKITINNTLSPPNFESYSFGIFSTENQGATWDTILKLEPYEYHTPRVSAIAYSHDTLIYIKKDSIFAYHHGLHHFLFESEIEILKIKINPKNYHWYFTGKTILKTSNGGKSFNYLHFEKSPEQKIKVENCDVDFGNETNAIIYDKGKSIWASLYENTVIQQKNIRTSISGSKTLLLYDAYRKQYLIGGLRMHLHNLKETKQISFPEFPNPQFMHDDIRKVSFDHLGNIYVANDAGLFVSENGGDNWFCINGCGLNMSEIYDFDINDEFLICGAQDNGTHIYKQKKWQNASELYGDGGMVLIKENQIYLMQNTILIKSLDTFKHFQFANFPIMMSRFNPKISVVNNVLYIADKHVWKENGSGWSNISNGIEPFYQISGLGVSADQNTIYVTKEDPVWGNDRLKNKFFKSTDAGLTWKDITINFKPYSYRFIKGLFLNPNNENELWVCIGGFDSKNSDLNRVFHSTDGAETWENISYNLPNIPCNVLCFDKQWGLIVGNDIGVYQLKDGYWKSLSNKLPKAPVTQIRRHHHWLFVSTYGRGIWKIEP